MSNGFSGTSSLMMSQSGYMKSPHSIPSEDIDNLSQHSDDLDDDLDRAPSPQVSQQQITQSLNFLKITSLSAAPFPDHP